MIYSWVRLFFLPDTARDARWSYKRKTGVALLVFIIVSTVVWYFQNIGNHLFASITLYGFYGLALCWIFWLMTNSNWH